MRIRQICSYNHITPPPPSDIASSSTTADQSPPPWVQNSPPVMISRINVSICSNQNPVTSKTKEENIPEKKSSGDKCSSSISTRTSSTASSVCSSSSLSCHGKWCEEEKVFPLKKRKLSLERFMIDQECEIKNKNKKKMGANSRMEMKNGLGRKDYGVGKKKAKTRRISSILNLPLLAKPNHDSAIHI
ncbi:uncharacterized protein LOC126678991 [Mercurialis annua]|uniref:uncharacterized protein LOC126678991 n=1 Tax=Mercurialis annua TaxID=3986 RepID=UPI00215F7F5C|nr:uncharacterized protein LOC126678991 [Mercurialis annua]